MTDIPATIVADQVIARQAIAISTLKQSAEQQQKLAEILEQSIENVPVSSVRGTNVDITVG